ncbi:hypothetical protein HMPREF3216_00700 [Gardnerella vaginalis]|uniref:Uncharacterized protein n=1 Tax=Gardnerella vaginalis TaxID=2702 RepID=A0A133NPG3_GARVA|nr:hypothetical protein HMPREF3216_00700 [Gardnerella vaginalis]
MGTNVGECSCVCFPKHQKWEQTWGSVPEFVYEIGQNGNKRGEKETNVGAL